MCVIITQPKGAYLSKEIAQAAWKRNPDGGGFAHTTNDGEIVIEKRMQFDAFWRAFETARADNRDQDFIVHFRIATHGSVCLDNVHPFVVNENTVMAHNGIIHGVPNDYTGRDRSDSRMFVDEVLPHMKNTWLDNTLLRKAIEEEIGWSKLAFLTTDPALEKSLYILNERSGSHLRGMWFSNKNGLQDFFPKPQHTSYTSKKKVVAPPKEQPAPKASSQGTHPQSGGNVSGKKREARIPTSGEEAPMFEDDWMPHPMEDGISSDESNRRWMDLSVEHELLVQCRSSFLHLGVGASRITYHPGEHRFFCKKCQAELNVDGDCACWDTVCMVCEHIYPECSCQSPRGVNLSTGEALDNGRLFT